MINILIFIPRADPNLPSSTNESPISLAVKHNLGKVVEILCVRGADKESLDSKSNPPLWNALKLEYFDIAETIVEQGADLDFWQQSGKVERTLLHRSLG